MWLLVNTYLMELCLKVNMIKFKISTSWLWYDSLLWSCYMRRRFCKCRWFWKDVIYIYIYDFITFTSSTLICVDIAVIGHLLIKIVTSSRDDRFGRWSYENINKYTCKVKESLTLFYYLFNSIFISLQFIEGSIQN